ncbi:MAG TPA: DUF177 domain-containing protein [Pyrinomonadaceae bacterium]|nr:DUF177 domain-containing protein [Pyrinomonadaceae bacterium]
MKLDLNKLDRDPIEFDAEIPASEFDGEIPGVEFKDGLRVAGQVEKQAGRIEVNGEISGKAAIDCTRCLESVDQQLSIPFEAVYVSADDFGEESDSEISGEDLKVDVLEGDSLDLAAIVREQVLLGLPAQTLCSEDCKGLCERCGANLNEGECKCGDDDIDPRWAALKGLAK